MGTNYYLHESTCKHCGKGEEKLHIGKSSGGWTFALHVIPEEGINGLDDWISRWSKNGSVIRSEYGEEISAEKMKQVITERSWAKQPGDGFDYRENSAEPGPDNLVRRKISRHCVGHGPGTWDLVTGEFS